MARSRCRLTGRLEPAGSFGLFATAADGSGELQPVSADVAASDDGSFAPDGRLVSYHSTRSGRVEVYLSPFPPTGERWQVSPDGGSQPRWSADG
jgi:Tol biopolymer transport system component